MPQVTVVIPVFNAEATVARAIASVLAQDFGGSLAIIAVNDGSTDATALVLERYADRVRIITQPNRGAAAARNAGIVASQSEFVAFLDADDSWSTRHLTLTVAPLERSATAVLAYSDMIPVDDRDEPMAATYIPRALARAPSLNDLLTRWWPIFPSTVVMRSATLSACGGFCEEYQRAAGHEDVDLCLRAREHGEFSYVDEPLVRYRVTPLTARMSKYEDNYELFRTRVTARYGDRARGLLRATRQAYVTALNHEGLLAMSAGDMPRARRAFIRALHYHRFDRKTLLRYGRTFLPLALAARLSGSVGKSGTGS